MAERMLEYNTGFIDNKAIIGILRRAYNHVDKRLMDHGIRVAYIVSRMLRRMPQVSAAQTRDLCFLAAMHDVGAYKTEEIDRMVRFETEEIWEHSVYGCLFIKNFTPLFELAPAILFHHAPWSELERMEDVSRENKHAAQLIHLADRLDIWLNAEGGSYADFARIVRAERGQRFEPFFVDLLLEQEFAPFTAEEVECDPAFQQMQAEISFTGEEIRDYLKMVIYSIDFRSRHTVTHTMTTTSISNELAEYMELGAQERNNVVCGALLHDLGKIGIPVEILEFPGKLSPQAMAVMRTHVDVTEEIFGGDIPSPIREIALRHHEKLDGSGYPRGLRAQQLSLEERIVALADIVSALAGTRSYKKAFGKERICAIITGMREDGLMDPALVGCMLAHYDEIMEKTRVRCQPVLEIYQKLQADYNAIYAQYAPVRV